MIGRIDIILNGITIASSFAKLALLIGLSFTPADGSCHLAFVTHGKALGDPTILHARPFPDENCDQRLLFDPLPIIHPFGSRRWQSQFHKTATYRKGRNSSSGTPSQAKPRIHSAVTPRKISVTLPSLKVNSNPS